MKRRSSTLPLPNAAYVVRRYACKPDDCINCALVETNWPAGWGTRASWKEWFYRWDGDGILKGLDTPIKTEIGIGRNNYYKEVGRS